MQLIVVSGIIFIIPNQGIEASERHGEQNPEKGSLLEGTIFEVTTSSDDLVRSIESGDVEPVGFVLEPFDPSERPKLSRSSSLVRRGVDFAQDTNRKGIFDGLRPYFGDPENPNESELRVFERAKEKMTQADIAWLLGTSPSVVSRRAANLGAEKQNNRKIKVDTLKKIARTTLSK